MTAVLPARPTAGSCFADRLGAHGDRVALVDGDSVVTYAELDERVDEVAERLGPQGRLVLVAGAHTTDALVAYLGALRGGHPVLLVPGDDDRAADSLATAYDPDVVVRPGSGWDVEERRSRSRHDLHPDLALLLSTSGSTGSPKLVRLSRRNVEANAAAIVRYLGITPADRAITTLPMHYCYGLSVLHSHLLAGAGVVFTDLSVVDRCFWDLFRSAGATSFAGVPHTFELLDRAGFEQMSLPTLRYVTQAGGRMRPEVVRRYAELGRRDGWQLFVMYGQTEATARMAYLPPALASTRPGAIGVPVPGGSFSIEDAGADGVGELVYRGPNVMLGYAESPADLALGATVDGLRTGDLARLDDAGLYEVVGRRSRFVKLFGLRVDMDRVEALLADAGVTALCTGDDDGLVLAVRRPAAAVDAAAVVAASVGLPVSRVRVVEVDELPRLASGKPDYAAVRAAAARQPRPTAAGADGGDAAGAVRAVFADVLGVVPSDHDSFVDLGGDSLSYVEASIRLEAVLGALPPDWQTRPVGELLPAPRPRRLGRQTETSVVLRAVAIALVVGTHTGLWFAPGGAHVLLGVAGWNLARFQLWRGGLWRSIARIAVPSACWIGVVTAATDGFGWRHALLLHGALDGRGRWAYWYVEALVPMLAVTAALFAIPAVRRLDRRHPFGVPMAVVAAGLAVRFDVVDVAAWHHRVLRPHEVVWLFALGWAAARADTTARRLVVSLVVVAAVPGFFGSASREAVVAAGLLLLLWARTVPLPPVATRAAGAVAAASLWIYLTHWQVYPPVLRAAGPLAAWVASIAAGVAVQRVIQRIARRHRGADRRHASSRSTDARVTPSVPSCSSPVSSAPVMTRLRAE